jgi:hypothetical protein
MDIIHRPVIYLKIQINIMGNVWRTLVRDEYSYLKRSLDTNS